MAAKKRKQYTADFKAKVALAACKGGKGEIFLRSPKCH